MNNLHGISSINFLLAVMMSSFWHFNFFCYSSLWWFWKRNDIHWIFSIIIMTLNFLKTHVLTFSLLFQRPTLTCQKLSKVKLDRFLAPIYHCNWSSFQKMSLIGQSFFAFLLPFARTIGCSRPFRTCLIKQPFIRTCVQNAVNFCSKVYMDL